MISTISGGPTERGRIHRNPGIMPWFITECIPMVLAWRIGLGSVVSLLDCESKVMGSSISSPIKSVRLVFGQDISSIALLVRWECKPGGLVY